MILKPTTGTRRNRQATGRLGEKSNELLHCCCLLFGLRPSPSVLIDSHSNKYVHRLVYTKFIQFNEQNNRIIANEGRF